MMKDRSLFDKVSLGVAIVSAIFAGLSFFSQIGLLGGKSTDSQAGIEELADTIVAENSMTSEAVTVSDNTVIGEANTVNEDIAIGENSIIAENNTIGNNTIIGNHNTVLNQYDLETDEEHVMGVNEILSNLSLGMNEIYVKDMLGTPMYQLEQHGLNNEFYKFEENIIIRCIFKEEEEKGVLVGYMVTAKRADASVEFPDPMHKGETLKFGYSTISSSESDTYKGEMAANLGNGEANSYYWQCYHLVQAEEASGFIVAILPYGFYEENSYKLMMLAGADEKMSSAYAGNDVDLDRVISEYKEQLHPNTYGIIDINYKEYIYPCVDEDETYWAACVKELMKD